MLTTARPIFEHVPATFADPVGLADQQAEGVVSLIVVRYPAHTGEASVSSTESPLPHPGGEGQGEGASPIPSARQRANPPSPPPEAALGATYDAFVAVSGQLLAVARTTPDYRFPVTPATALARFLRVRDGDHPAFLSLYELAEADCARFLETVFYAECLKLHVSGAECAPLVADQVARSGCGDGVLEVNDFSDADAPRVRLVDLDALTPDVPLADLLADALDGVTGRVLLYDRVKNRAALPGRVGRAFDLEAAIEQANRLAAARRGTPADHHAAALEYDVPEADESPPDPAEAYLESRSEHLRPVASDHPHAHALGALVSELQGGIPFDALPLSPTGDGASGDASPDLDIPPLVVDTPDGQRHSGTTPPNESPSSAPEADSMSPSSPIPSERQDANPLSPASDASLHRDLDRLRTETFDLLAETVGRDHADEHEAHVLDAHGIPRPVPAERTVEYLRALLTDDPPRRRHGFKRARAKTYGTVAGKLLALHGAHRHLDDPAVHDAARLWTRLHR